MHFSVPAALGKTTSVAAVLLCLLLTPSCAWIQSLAGIETPAKSFGSESHWTQGLMHRADGRLEQAALEFELAIQSDPNMYHAYYQLGRTYQAMGKKKQARAIWRTGMEKARLGPDRSDYPRLESLAQMRSALEALDSAPPNPPPARWKAKRIKARPRAKSSGGYAVLFSSNLKIRSARGDVARLKKLGYAVMVRTRKYKGRTWHRVWAGCCTSRAAAEALRRGLLQRGLGRGFIVMKPNR